MMERKGSMSLGINAIVILIMALAILGLGMSFITKLFGSSSDKFSSIIDTSELPFNADSSDPLVFENTDVTVKAGKETKLKAAIYNVLSTRATVIFDDTSLVCVGDDSDVDLSLLSGSQDVASGEEVGFNLIIRSGNEVPTGTYICTIKAYLESAEGESNNEEDHVSRQIFVNVIR